MKRELLRIVTGLTAGALVLFAATFCRADSSFDVNLDTSPLTTMVGHTFSLDFQFNDGSPAGGDGNNTVSLSNFAFGGGSATAGTVVTTGGIAGDLVSGVTLTDSSFLNEFTQDFTPGSLLGFHVAMTNNVGSGEDPGSGGTPDEFSFAILDNGNEISSDPSGALLLTDIVPGGPTSQTFAADSSYGSIQPIVTTDSTATPEPQTWETLGMGLLGLAFALRRRRPLRKRSFLSRGRF